MGSIGDVLARRAGSPGAKVLPGRPGYRDISRRLIPAAEIRRAAALIEAGQHLFPGVDRPLPQAAGTSTWLPDGGSLAAGSSVTSVAEALADGAAAVEFLRASAAADARLFGFGEAADFAGRVEDLSRQLEYVQIVAAQAVERTRREALQAPAQQAGHSQQAGRSQQAGPGGSAAAPQWRTGWTEATQPSGPSAGPAPFGDITNTAAVPGSVPATHSPATATTAVGSGAVGSVVVGSVVVGSVLDDGYRNAAEFLRARLRIGISEARRRLALTPEVLTRTGTAGQKIPARREQLATALAEGTIASRHATIISTALDKVQHLAPADLLTRMEHALTTTATETDPDFLTKMANRWIDRIDQDGPEPSEETLRQLQGAFLRRRRRHGLHHLEIFATTEQYETLTTAMNIATNPRLTTSTSTSTNPANTDSPGGTGNTQERAAATGEATEETGTKPTSSTTDSPGPELDRRSRAQKLLDGLVGACAVAMTTGKLPSNGGLRPQLTITIDHRDLFTQLTNLTQSEGNTAAPNPLSTGTATFTGPLHPDTIRKIACDAEILPVLLGTDSQILNIGRTTRIFPPHIRKAITARDGGCTFPDCTIPAPWCEAHHTTYWSHGGPTSTNNGTLLCSHHHHLIHKEQWRINMTTGTPWFIPPPHIDPHQTPRRNHHHTPQRT